VDEHKDGEQDTAEGGAPPAAGVRWSLLRSLWEWTRTLAVTVLVFLVLRVFVVEAFRIPTGSMENTLLAGDFLLVNKAVYGAEVPGTTLHIPAFAEPRRGELVVFVPPHDPSKNYVKRLVGVPGDTLEMRDKVLVRNGVPVDEPYVLYQDREGDAVHPSMKWQAGHLLAGPDDDYRPTRDNWGPLVVPGDQYFFLGDNRDNSEDSRYWGFVPREAIRGRPWFVYYSFDPAARGRLPWLRSARWDRVGLAVQ
jgi:signal peptidase I